MPYTWPEDTDFAFRELDVLDRACAVCGRTRYVCDHRYRRVHTLEGPVQLVCKLNHRPDRNCPSHHRTKRPELETTIAPPKWAIGWDVFCRIGHRRHARHRSISQIQSDLQRGSASDRRDVDGSGRAALFCTRTYNRILRPGLALITPEEAEDDSELRRGFDQFDEQIERWMERQKVPA